MKKKQGILRLIKDKMFYSLINEKGEKHYIPIPVDIDLNKINQQKFLEVMKKYLINAVNKTEKNSFNPSQIEFNFVNNDTITYKISLSTKKVKPKVIQK